MRDYRIYLDPKKQVLGMESLAFVYGPASLAEDKRRARLMLEILTRSQKNKTESSRKNEVHVIRGKY